MFALRSFIVSLALVAAFFAPAAFAETIETKAEILQDNGGDPLQLTTAVAKGEADAEALLAKQLAHVIGGDAVISSEFSEERTQDFIQAAQGNGQATSKREKLLGLGFVFLQWGIGSVSFWHFSQSETVTPAVMYALVSGALTYYYRPEKQRWSYFQRFGRNLLSDWADRLGLKGWRDRHKAWFETGAKSLTGYVGTAGVASIFVGIGLWDRFKEIIFSDVAGFLGMVGQRSGMSFLMSQPYDTLFDSWLERGHRKLSPEAVRMAQRSKSLLLAGLGPMIYLGEPTAIAAAFGISIGGWSLLIYDSIKNKSSCEELLQSSAAQ